MGNSTYLIADRFAADSSGLQQSGIVLIGSDGFMRDSEGYQEDNQLFEQSDGSFIGVGISTYSLPTNSR